MNGRRSPDAAWRRSYDIDDPRAQVSTIYWQASERNENAFKFFDVIRKAIWQYADHIRKPGKPLPICANAMRVFEALVSHMDFRTGRCDPSLDTITATCKLSRRTVVRQLDVLRRERLIDWTRRTVKTGHAPGEGPQRKQTSNAYFIDLARLPVEIVRTLRQKLGDKLREAKRKLEGSGPVPTRLGGKAAKLVASLTGALGTALGRDAAERRALAGASSQDRLAHMYHGDPEGLRLHLEMLGHASYPSASATLALYPSIRTKG
ncbi:helix-turn-helix domain-containing protein [Novosphingobium sp. PP1Y]|uniref:helix-turn-helix domain-containing protein n=1 Tax=Novosphingobium sp. PP1Y TaxID=702113 RepID=UPI00020EEC40|nr:helix-turn-helix domain-containing protein [Novosphingobium sp. PP1Y]CCA92528.1 replication protein A [Novosphingobium sp. PP1Y]